MYKFSIVTPTYNRATYLPNIFTCLLQQLGIKLEWIIVDDGSTDNTKEIVSSFSDQINIKYIFQKNFGKPSAVNTGIKIADSYITVILDSDDILLPATLKKIWSYFDTNNESFIHQTVAVSGLCIDQNDELIGKKFPKNFFISNHIQCRFNLNISGDKCEFFLTKTLKANPFPIIEQEKFITEAIIWNRIAIKSNTLYVNIPLKKVKYMIDGLTNQYNQLLKDNPKGWELYFNEATTLPLKLLLKINNSANYIKFAKINKSNIYKNAKNKTIFIFGFFLYLIKKIKNKGKIYFEKN